MLAPLKAPAITAAYTLVGLLLTRWWFDGHYWPAILLLVVSTVLALAIWPIGSALITRQPLRALTLFESYAWVNGLLAAAAVCVSSLAAITLGGIAPGEDPLKSLIGQAGTALTTLVAGIFVAAKDADETLGKRIGNEFKSRFTMEGQVLSQERRSKEPPAVLRRWADEAKRELSPSLIAVFAEYANGWTDWSEDNRRARVKSLAANLDKDKVEASRTSDLPGAAR